MFVLSPVDIGLVTRWIIRNKNNTYFTDTIATTTIIPTTTSYEYDTMATAERLIKCLFCQEECISPMRLPCLHTYCSACLDEHISHSLTDTFKCPECQSQFPSDRMREVLHQEASVGQTCNTHNRRPMTLCCDDCEVEICYECVTVPKHKGHSFSKIENDIINNQIQEEIRETKRCKTSEDESVKEPTMSLQAAQYYNSVLLKACFSGQVSNDLKFGEL